MSKQLVLAVYPAAVAEKVTNGDTGVVTWQVTTPLPDSVGLLLGEAKGATQAWANAWIDIQADEADKVQIAAYRADKAAGLVSGGVLSVGAIVPAAAPVVTTIAPTLRMPAPSFSAEFQQLRGIGRYGRPTRAAMAQR